ncbi:MAG: hypothetical protein J5720_06165 [Bacteroidaceae bacterium]|nr:hypothetical protein [Bacteroidaceae bacterium]
MKRYLLFILLLSGNVCIYSQEPNSVTICGSVQTDMLMPQNDERTGAQKEENVQANVYVDMMLQSRYVDADIRVEYMEHPIPGFEKDFKGWGVPHFWAKGRIGCAELTAGTFYEQFGSGFILRTYEDRSTGVDNSLLGGRLVVRPVNGVTLKVLSGKQRCYWKWNKSLVSGAEAELNLEEWIPSMQRTDIRLMLGGSWVNKYEKTEDIFASPTYKYNLPEFVNAWDVRASMNTGPWNLLVEYAQKTQDPSFDNGFSYDRGTAAMFSGSYSEKGLSLLLQVKRSENMSFRSRRLQMGTSSFINHLPAFTQDQTYALAALYPYATQLGGEWAWQAEVGYAFKRKTALGGRYGMNIKANFSHVRWEGATYYQNLDVQLTRRLSRDFKLNLMYMNRQYDKTVVEGEGGMIHSNIFVADGLYQIAPKVRLRTELQYLATADDEGDWSFGLLELSLAPRWMLTVSDMWNNGSTKTHYYQGLVTCHLGLHHLQAGYGRTRAGYNCSGGVCRYVPATKGFTLSYNYSF